MSARHAQSESLRSGWGVYVASCTVQGCVQWQCIEQSLYPDLQHCVIWWRLNSHRWPGVPYLILPAAIPLH